MDMATALAVSSSTGHTRLGVLHHGDGEDVTGGCEGVHGVGFTVYRGHVEANRS